MRCQRRRRTANMLSYMLPAEEKPPSGLGPKTSMQLQLTSISKENSISSFASDATTVTASSATPTSVISDRSKAKLLINGKHQTLKRVSFGSSKGSMVETLIYETPVETDQPSPIVEVTPFPEDHDQTEDEREKVRVSFVQQLKPLEVVLPDEPVIIADSDFVMAATMNDSNHVVMYNRQESTDSGWDNPFRPGGDLSREADEIVELIKGGKPITPTSGGADGGSPLPPSYDHIDSNNTSTPIVESPKKTNATTVTSTPKGAKNGNAQNATAVSPTAGPPGVGPRSKSAAQEPSVDVQRGTVGQPTEVEHVVLKKKQKCKCCVIQ